jgi:hypothetical protein
LLPRRGNWVITAPTHNIGFGNNWGTRTMDGPNKLSGLIFAGTAIAIVLAFIVV